MEPVQERVFATSRPRRLHDKRGSSDDFQIDFARLSRAARRQVPVVALCALIGATLAVLAVLGSVPRYTSVETVLLDEERADLLNQVSPLPNAVLSDSSIQSELEIIKSQALAYDVVDRLGLDTDEAFMNPPSGPTQDLIAWVESLTDPLAALLSRSDPAPTGSSELAEADDSEMAEKINLELTDRDRAASMLRRNLMVSRAGRSFVIEIGYQGYDPVRSARIARAYGLIYERYQLNVAERAAGNAANWLQDRLVTLEQQSLDAGSAVQRYRAENNLVEVRGSLLTEQQQSELASELVASAAETAGARARLDSMQFLLDRAKSGDAVVLVPRIDGGSNALIEELRREYLDASLRYTRLVEDFGDDHPQAIELAASIEDLQSILGNELEQATESARIAYEVARSREQSLRNDLQTVTDTSDANVAVRGRLRQLEAIADTYASLYSDFLERFELTSQQQGFPIASVKVISPAEVPVGASSPKKKSTLLAGLFLGGLVGIMIAAALELKPKPLRAASEVRGLLDLACVGLIPVGSQPSAEAVARTKRRSVERLARACRTAGRGPHGTIVSLVPLLPADSDENDLPTQLADRLAQDTLRVLLVNDSDAPFGAAREAGRNGFETAGMDLLLNHYANAARNNGQPFDVEAIAEDLRNSFDFVLMQSEPLSGASRHCPLSAIYDVGILRIPWGKVRPSFAAEALEDHPVFRMRLVTTVLEGAQLRKAREYMTPGSYEERETYA